MIQNIIGGIIAGIILIVIGILFRRYWWNLIKKNILIYLTRKNLTDICEYNIAREKMQNLLVSSKIIKKKQPALKIMCVKGKDITGELEEGIEIFLKNGGEAMVLILDPESKYVDKRANELSKGVNGFRKSIEGQINNIKDEYSDWFNLERITIKKYDWSYTFRMNFIGEALFLGFYNERLPDYKNIWYQIPRSSELYKTLEKLFDEIQERCENV